MTELDAGLHLTPIYSAAHLDTRPLPEKSVNRVGHRVNIFFYLYFLGEWMMAGIMSRNTTCKLEALQLLYVCVR